MTSLLTVLASIVPVHTLFGGVLSALLVANYQHLGVKMDYTLRN